MGDGCGCWRRYVRLRDRMSLTVFTDLNPLAVAIDIARPRLQCAPRNGSWVIEFSSHRHWTRAGRRLASADRQEQQSGKGAHGWEPRSEAMAFFGCIGWVVGRLPVFRVVFMKNVSEAVLEETSQKTEEEEEKRKQKNESRENRAGRDSGKTSIFFVYLFSFFPLRH